MDEKFALPAAGPGQCAQNPALIVKKYDITGRDRLLLPLTLAVCTLAADSFLLHGLGLGVTVTVLAWYALLGLRLGWGRLTAGSGKWLLAANILLGLWYAMGSGWYFRLWNFGALAILPLFRRALRGPAGGLSDPGELPGPALGRAEGGGRPIRLCRGAGAAGDSGAHPAAGGRPLRPRDGGPFHLGAAGAPLPPGPGHRSCADALRLLSPLAAGPSPGGEDRGGARALAAAGGASGEPPGSGRPLRPLPGGAVRGALRRTGVPCQPRTGPGADFSRWSG